MARRLVKAGGFYGELHMLTPFAPPLNPLRCCLPGSIKPLTIHRLRGVVEIINIGQLRGRSRLDT